MTDREPNEKPKPKPPSSDRPKPEPLKPHPGTPGHYSDDHPAEKRLNLSDD